MSITRLSSYDKVNWCVTQNAATKWHVPNLGTLLLKQTPALLHVVIMQQVVTSEISLVGTTGARLPNTRDPKTAEILNAKKILDKDHKAILEEIGMR